MKLTESQIQKLAHLIYDKLSQNKMIELIASSTEVINKIATIIHADAQKEVEIENLAKKTLESYQKQIDSGEIDRHKMFQMIKKQLMKEHKFTP